MSHRMQVVVPDPVASQLREFAAAAGEAPSTFAAQMIRRGVAFAAGEGTGRPLAGRREGERASFAFTTSGRRARPSTFRAFSAHRSQIKRSM